MSCASLPITFWGYVIEKISHILNLVPSKKVVMTPHEMWTWKFPTLNHIKVWGCEVFFAIKPKKNLNLDLRDVTLSVIHKDISNIFYRPSANLEFVARKGLVLER